MKNTFLFIALFMAATAVTSSEHDPNAAHPDSTSSALEVWNMYKNKTITTTKTTTHSNSTTTTAHPNTTTTTANPNTTTTTAHPNTTTTTAHPNTTTTTAHPNTTTTTAHPNTTTTTAHPNTTTTTAHPKTTTTTAHPNTTTTTAHPNTTTTTAHPSTTTTTAKTTTTPMPRPTPPTNTTVGHYNVTDINHKLCVMADFAVKIRVNNSEVNGTFIVQPAKTNFSGNCDNQVASLFLQFDEGAITLKFRNNSKAQVVYVETLEYDLTYAFKSGVSMKFSGKNESLQLFEAAAGHSYSCKAMSVSVGKGVHLDFTKSRVQAFNIQKNNFGKTDLCKADQPNYGVPIAVAVILIILIVIMVIAYFFRRKRRTSGYQSL